MMIRSRPLGRGIRMQFHRRAPGPPSRAHRILRYRDRGMWRSLNTDDAVSHGDHERLELRMRAELGQDVDHMGALRLDRDVQLYGDLAVRATVGQRLEHLALARGQLVRKLPPYRGTLPLPPRLPQDLDKLAGVDQRTAGGDGADGIDDLADRGRL